MENQKMFHRDKNHPYVNSSLNRKKKENKQKKQQCARSSNLCISCISHLTE